MTYKMYYQNFQAAYYGANLYNAYFWNQTAVMANVLTNATVGDNATALAIYNDPECGMNSGKAMMVWVAAYLQQ